MASRELGEEEVGECLATDCYDVSDSDESHQKTIDVSDDEESNQTEPRQTVDVD